MRVVVLSQWYLPEKATISSDIAKALVDEGHQVTVLTGFPNYPGGRIYEGWRQRPVLKQRCADYDIFRVALYPSHDRNVVRRAANYLSFALTSTILGWGLLRSADVIYVYHPPLTAALGPWLSRRLGGAPYVLHVQDLWPDTVMEAGLLPGRFLRVVGRVLTAACEAAYRSAAAIICIAPTMADLLYDRGVPKDRLRVVPNWADETIFHPAPRDESLRQEFGFADHFTVMFAGNTGEIQGLDVAIRAAAEVKDLSDFRLVLVGDGVALAALRKLAHELGAANVLFVPPQPLDAMNHLSQSADIQLVILRDLPFLQGTIPSKLGVILAMGMPVICSVGGDAQACVRESGAGWTCLPGDAKSLARSYRSAYGSSVAERQVMGSAGRIYYNSKLSRQLNALRIVAELVAAGTESTRGERLQ